MCNFNDGVKIKFNVKAGKIDYDVCNLLILQNTKLENEIISSKVQENAKYHLKY